MSKLLVLLALCAVVAVAFAVPAPQQEGRPAPTGEKETDLQSANSFYGGYYGGFGYPFHGGYGYGFGHPGFYGHGFYGHGFGYPYYG
ncbi:unnamed protein product [Allacma fusca]|uniref:Uncharacterized protein n=1 Tax=Allacma fusca TaxID=39272 RepID=A0A8J2M8N2_9HEXA|nr:unnamed protein product [Allacma fusca]